MRELPSERRGDLCYLASWSQSIEPRQERCLELVGIASGGNGPATTSRGS
jgi:hypothetical protein